MWYKSELSLIVVVEILCLGSVGKRNLLPLA